MTEPHDPHRDRDTEATTADRNLEVKPELIKDLDVTGEDADVWGGCSFTRVTAQMNVPPETERSPGQAR
jgi:hypothetical protein